MHGEHDRVGRIGCLSPRVFPLRATYPGRGNSLQHGAAVDRGMHARGTAEADTRGQIPIGLARRALG